MAIYRLELDDNGAPRLVEEENGSFDQSNVPPWWLQDYDLRSTESAYPQRSQAA